MSKSDASRRTLLTRGAAIVGAAALGGCDKVINSDQAQAVFDAMDKFNQAAQQPLLADQQLAPEYTQADLSPRFYANGSTNPDDPDYQRMSQNRFADYRLIVDGDVDKPLKLSLNELRAMPSRTQITRHDCVEGWSCIGKWKGVPLSHILGMSGVKPEARYVVFHCFDTMADSGSLSAAPEFYGSIDLMTAAHAQTILAYEMNDATLPIPYGAPLRLRLGRQLGYKMSKYIKRIALVQSFDHIGNGKGGYWEDNGYQWYAGI